MAPTSVVKGGRILVVDDEPMVRDTLRQVLADEGYVVDAATDGADALACVHAARPDVILLDLMMPGMNGRQFLQELRDDPAYAAVPVLIMTAVHGLNVNLASVGASEILEKPFHDLDDLLNKVALAVYRSRDADRAHVPLAVAAPEPAPEPTDRGVVLVVEHDRERLQQLDVELSERGYTVVSMTRAPAQLVRLARAVRPRAVLLEAGSEGVAEVAGELRETPGLSVLVFARDDGMTDEGLVAFLERKS